MGFRIQIPHAVGLLSAALVFLFMLLVIFAVRFNWKRLIRPGVRSDSAVGPGWTHGTSGTRLLPGFKAEGVVVHDGKVSAKYFTEILEHRGTYEPIFRCTVLSPTGEELFVVNEKSPSRTFSSVVNRLGCGTPGHKSGPEFFLDMLDRWCRKVFRKR